MTITNLESERNLCICFCLSTINVRNHSGYNMSWYVVQTGTYRRYNVSIIIFLWFQPVLRDQRVGSVFSGVRMKGTRDINYFSSRQVCSRNSVMYILWNSDDSPLMTNFRRFDVDVINELSGDVSRVVLWMSFRTINYILIHNIILFLSWTLRVFAFVQTTGALFSHGCRRLFAVSFDFQKFILYT